MGAKLANDVKVIPHLVQDNPHGYEVNIGPLQAPDTMPKDYHGSSQQGWQSKHTQCRRELKGHGIIPGVIPSDVKARQLLR